MSMNFITEETKKYCDKHPYDFKERVIAARAMKWGWHLALCEMYRYLDYKGMKNLAKEIEEKINE